MAAQQPSLFGDDAKTCLARADEQLKQVTQKHRELIQLFNNGFKHAWNQVPGALALEAGAMKEAMQTGNLSRAQELYNDFSDRTGELSSVLTYVEDLNFVCQDFLRELEDVGHRRDYAPEWANVPDLNHLRDAIQKERGEAGAIQAEAGIQDRKTKGPKLQSP